MRIPKPKPQEPTIEELRERYKRMIEELDKMASHIARMQDEYSTIEDELNNIDKAITQKQKDTGIVKEQIYQDPGDPLLDIEATDFDGLS